MKLAAIIAVIFLVALVALALTGYMLPATREGTATRTFDAPSDLVRRTILDIDSQPSWRARVVAIDRSSDDGWTEVAADGERVAFRLLDDVDTKITLEFASSRGYTGRWDADIAANPTGGTTLNVREQATTPSPIGRILSRLFFDPEAFAATYLDELAAEVGRRGSVTE
jgi:hypothetical protein